MKSPYAYDLERYYGLPKEFVDPKGADELFSLYERLKRNETSYGYLYAAGSAVAESGLLATGTSPDIRHARIEAARTVWQKAQDAYLYSHMTKGWGEARLFIIPDKTQLQLSFIDIYHEMVDGFVDERSLGKLHASLVRQACLNKDMHDYSDAIGDWSTATGRRGLGYEINAILTVTRLGCPTLFAMPSTARSDNGTHHSNETHDVRVVQQSYGKINWWVPTEVKPTDYYSDDYDAPLVRGRVELLLPSSTNPLDTAVHMERELSGTITQAELLELDDLTSRVLGLVRDYRARKEFEEIS